MTEKNSLQKKLSVKAFDELPDVFLADSKRAGDARGNFSRLFCDDELSSIVKDRKIVQINHSFTQKKGSVRGLHFQRPPHAEMKIVRCIRGHAWDVVVDLRKNSSTFMTWEAIDLTPDLNRMILIPEGFAHGFQTMSDDCELLYLHTAHFNQESEGGFRWNDESLNIAWPLPVTEISERDQKLPLTDQFRGLEL